MRVLACVRVRLCACVCVHVRVRVWCRVCMCVREYGGACMWCMRAGLWACCDCVVCVCTDVCQDIAHNTSVV